jgi:hypothetical protein
VLASAGIEVKNWDGKTGIPFLVVGRNALLQQYQMPFSLEAFIANGGKVLMMNQHPDSFAVKKGFRVSQYISRYVFPVDKKHPLFRGLDEANFRNWTGVSKLTEAYPDYINKECGTAHTRCHIMVGIGVTVAALPRGPSKSRIIVHGVL